MISELRFWFYQIKDLIRYLRWWEIYLPVFLFLFLFGRGLYGIPSVDDADVYRSEDIIVKWTCSGGGKTEFQIMVGASGQSYKMGGTRNVCSESKGEEYYVGKKVYVYYKEGGEKPIQLDFEDGSGYKAGIKAHKVVGLFLIFGFPIFLTLIAIASHRRRSK